MPYRHCCAAGSWENATLPAKNGHDIRAGKLAGAAANRGERTGDLTYPRHPHFVTGSAISMRVLF